jgi:tetratricopeptide (TPR) repeat protein
MISVTLICRLLRLCAARLLSKLKSPDAEEAWCALIQHNPDSYDAYRGYLENEGLSVGAFHRLLAFHPTLSSSRGAQPRSDRETGKICPDSWGNRPSPIATSLAFGDQFRQLVKPYIIRGLEKGIPSLFADLKALYVHKEKQIVIEDIVDSLREEYAPTTDTSRNKELDPTTYLWTLYFLAQHYSYLSHQSKALEILDIAIEHTPTLPELYMLRGKVLKRAGDYFGAAKFVNEARILDGQDRFLNTKCGKYLLRAGMVDEAMPIFGLFTKVGCRFLSCQVLSSHATSATERCT